MRLLLPSLLLQACLFGCVTQVPHVDTAKPDECVAEDLPEPAAGLTLDVYSFDPVEECWRTTAVPFDADHWSAYAPTDTGGPSCDDVTVIVPRVDCSCVVLPAACGEVATALTADPAVDQTSAGYASCVAMAADPVACP